jgi:hypothetical protein
MDNTEAAREWLKSLSDEDFRHVEIALVALNRIFKGELNAIPAVRLRDFIIIAETENNNRLTNSGDLWTVREEM